MKGKIHKFTDFYTGIRKYRIAYIPNMEKFDILEDKLDILEEDMGEFIDDIFSSWMKLDNKTEIIERRAREAVRARKGLHQCEVEEAYREGYINGRKEVITKQEEAEQDKDEREREKLLIEKYKTYNNPFPTDEALNFDVNVREKV